MSVFSETDLGNIASGILTSVNIQTGGGVNWREDAKESAKRIGNAIDLAHKYRSTNVWSEEQAKAFTTSIIEGEAAIIAGDKAIQAEVSRQALMSALSAFAPLINGLLGFKLVPTG